MNLSEGQWVGMHWLNHSNSSFSQRHLRAQAEDSTYSATSSPTEGSRSGIAVVIFRPGQSEVDSLIVPVLTKISGPTENLTFDLVEVKDNICGKAAARRLTSGCTHSLSRVTMGETWELFSPHAKGVGRELEASASGRED